MNNRLRQRIRLIKREYRSRVRRFRTKYPGALAGLTLLRMEYNKRIMSERWKDKMKKEFVRWYKVPARYVYMRGFSAFIDPALGEKWEA